VRNNDVSKFKLMTEITNLETGREKEEEEEEGEGEEEESDAVSCSSLM
jgi:hypothetical protein